MQQAAFSNCLHSLRVCLAVAASIAAAAAVVVLGVCASHEGLPAYNGAAASYVRQRHALRQTE
jgi:hypothetical protein